MSFCFRFQDDSCKSDNLYRGITACTADQHVHVEGSTDFVSKLINLAEPELNGLRQERHAKTIEIAQKEVLTCIGICLYERFQRIQQKLREGQQSCDILFLVALKSLKKSYDMYFESKQGISDLERLCQEFDEEDRRKLEKAQKKRDKKSKQQLKKKKDQDKVEPGNDQTDGIARITTVMRTSTRSTRASLNRASVVQFRTTGKMTPKFQVTFHRSRLLRRVCLASRACAERRPKYLRRNRSVS